MTDLRVRNLHTGIPPTSPQISHRDFKNLAFKGMILDAADGHSIVETDHPEGYNMILLHPRTLRLHWCYSYDFEDNIDDEEVSDE